MHKKIVSSLYFQVILAITIGILLGHFYPSLGADMKPLGDGFVKLIKMIIAPVIFCTVVTGIAGMESMKAVGKTGAIALIYFEVVSTLALIIGLCVVNLLQPGVGMNVDPSSLDASAISAYAEQAQSQGIVAFLLDVIPASVIGAFASGNILQVLLFAVLFGFSLHHIGEKGKAIFNIIDGFSQVIFGIINMIMKLAPVGAFGAMAFTIGKYGIGSPVQLGQLIASFYLTCLLFIFPGAWQYRQGKWLQHSALYFLHPGRAADRARHFLIGIRIAAHAGEDGGARLQEVGGGPGDPDRLLLQPGRHLHLPDHGRRLHRPGDQHPAGLVPSAHSAGGAAHLLQGGGRGHGQRLHRAGGDHLGGGTSAAGRAGADPRD